MNSVSERSTFATYVFCSVARQVSGCTKVTCAWKCIIFWRERFTQKSTKVRVQFAPCHVSIFLMRDQAEAGDQTGVVRNHSDSWMLQTMQCINCLHALTSCIKATPQFLLPAWVSLFYIGPFTLCQPSSLQIKESEKIKDLGIFGKLLRTNWFLYKRKIIFQH